MAWTQQSSDLGNAGIVRTARTPVMQRSPNRCATKRVTINMDRTRSDYSLFLPSCQETQGQTQPLATALSLDAAKNLCHQHFLKQCRTMQLRLPHEKRMS